MNKLHARAELRGRLLPRLAARLLLGCWLFGGNVPVLAAIEDFSRYPAYQLVTISPLGNYLAVSHRSDDRDILSILQLPSLAVAYSRSFGPFLSLTNVVWATDRRLLLQPARRFPAQHDFEVPTGEIAAIDVDGGDPELLFGYRAGIGQLGIRARKKTPTMAAAEIIDRLPTDPDHVIIQTLGFGPVGKRNEALLLNIHDGSTRTLAHSPIRNGHFVTGLEHRVGLVAGTSDAGDYEVYLRESGSKEFRLADTGTLVDGSLEPIMSATRAGHYLFSDTASAPTRGLVDWNPQTNERREIFRHPDVDFATFFIGPGRHVWAIRYVDHFPAYHYPDPEHPFVALHRRLRASFPADDVRIINQTDDLSQAIVRVTGPQNPGSFLLLDVKTQAIRARLDTRPWLRDRPLATMQPIEVTVRDGLKVRGYLSLPPGQESDQGLPLVVIVHGGPHGIEDTWGFDEEAQMLTERGYAVLQMNFRGSGGRGRHFLTAGFGQWGEKMQDDVTDGVRYLIDEGVVDHERICIYGASYGAYSALVGAYRNPDLYRCAAGYAGIYDLPLMFKAGDVQEALAGVNFLEAAIGTDPAELQRRSPAFNAGSIEARVMLIHGKKDQRAPFVQARRMRKALIDAGKPPEWLVENKEGHGFANEDNRLAMYQALLAFFDENLMPE